MAAPTTTIGRHVSFQAAKLRSRTQNALVRARFNGGPQAATPVGGDRYLVVGRAGDRYTVLVAGLDSDHIICDCPAGFHRFPCWHQAAAWLRSLADRAAAQLEEAA